MSINLVQKAEIALLVAQKVIFLVKYSDFADVFSKELAVKLFQYSNIIEDLINLKLTNQLADNQIYILKPVELEILKTHITIKLGNGFI